MVLDLQCRQSIPFLLYEDTYEKDHLREQNGQSRALTSLGSLPPGVESAHSRKAR
jgi:hypothetical protein